MRTTRRSTVWIVTVAIAVSSISALPVLLVGGFAVFLQRDLEFGEALLGFAIAAYFTSGAIAAAPAGLLAERVGPIKTVWLGLSCSLGSLLGVALVAHSWAALTAFLSVGGVGNAVTQLGVNVMVVRGVAAHRHGVAFGVTQGAFPLAALLAGVAVPAIGQSLGWEWAFILGAALVPVGGAVMATTRGPVLHGGRSPALQRPITTLFLVTVAMGLASATGTSATTFIAASSVDRGYSPGDAGLVLAVAGMVAIAVRVLAGWLADRPGSDALTLMAVVMVLGAIGYIGLAFVGRPILVFPFAALALGGGLGWSGLALLAVSQTNPMAPGAALGVAYIGGMTGAVVGPLAFGVVADFLSFSAAWLVLAALAALGVGVGFLSKQRIGRDHRRAVSSAAEDG